MYSYTDPLSHTHSGQNDQCWKIKKITESQNPVQTTAFSLPWLLCSPGGCYKELELQWLLMDAYWNEQHVEPTASPPPPPPVILEKWTLRISEMLKRQEPFHTVTHTQTHTHIKATCTTLKGWGILFPRLSIKTYRAERLGRTGVECKLITGIE